MEANDNTRLYPVTIEEEEQQLHIAIMQSLQDSSNSEESDDESATAVTASSSGGSVANDISNDFPAKFDSSSQMMLRRSMSMGNQSPPRTAFFTDCCEVKNALLLKDREHVKCLMTSRECLTSPLHAAVTKGHDYCLDALLQAFPELVNSSNANGETPLYLAAVHSKPIALNRLLQCQADPNIGRNSMETPLLVAVDNDHREIVLSLLKAGSQPNKALNRGWTVLHEAVYRGHVDILGMLLRHGGDPNTRDGFGISPVFTSAACGRSNCLKQLLQAGGEPNMCSKSRMASPLYEACKEGHVGCVTTLLRHGASPHLVNCDGLFPIHIAAYQGYSDIVKHLLEVTNRQMAESCGMSPLHSAAKGNHVEILEMLIKSGYDVNVKITRDKITYRDRRQTALFFAVDNDSEDATKLLLEAGAGTEVDYIKPLLVAVRHSQKDIVDLLLSYGANVNANVDEDLGIFPAAIVFAMRDFRMLKQVLVSRCDVTMCLHCEIGDENHSNFPDYLRKRSFCHYLTEDSNRLWWGSTLLFILHFAPNIKLCHLVKEVIKESDDWPQIKELTESPRSLQHYCRLTIRNSLDGQAIKDEEIYKSLPVPKPIVDYLMFSEV
ncbi:dynein axonemal heavy chain 12-like [Clavelina lepadiformis]|uniref:dynein axonemal heavy chain 12-like n=1 Tax=Clavelina lepadiformis TaxID=159417 RepID=UPI0040419C2E